MNKEYELFTRLTTFILEHNIECEEDIYQNDSVAEDSLELIEDLFDIVKTKNNNEHSAITNADRIRAMTDEELAVSIMCPAEYDLGFSKECKCTGEMNRNCRKCTLKWLQSEAE